MGDVNVRSVSDFETVTETEFPFSEQERKDGVPVVGGSLSHQIWELVTQRDPVLKHPYSNDLGTIEHLALECAAACETEIHLHSQYVTIADHVAHLDEETFKGVEVPELNRSQLMKDSDYVYRDWELACLRAEQLRKVWMAYRNDRLARVAKAINLCKQIHDTAHAPSSGSSVGEWEPSSSFADALEDHAQALRMGRIEMTSYYLIQSCVAKLTGRPLFLSTELSRAGGLALRQDKYNRGPVTGELVERMKLLAVAN